MVLFIVLGVVVVISFVILGVLFFLLRKEAQKEQSKAVPVTDLAQLKKELSSQLFEINENKVLDNGTEVIPVFQPKVSIDSISSISQSSLQGQSQDKQPSLEDDAYKKRAHELEDELRAISQKADGQSDEAKQLIESLTKENESLKSQQADLAQAKQRLTELEGESANLKVENIDLQTQLGSTNAKVHFLEEEMAAVKIQMGEEISRANAVVSQLNREKESLLSTPKTALDETLGHELEALRSEHIQLKQKCEDLESARQKLSELNIHLKEENDLLQYELIKARAQSSGLERVSFNYKNQLEDFFNKINAVQVTNEHLSKVKNQLEEMVEEIKLQNEELAKKDQLAQFELEKNRLRLVNLELENEGLKARVQ
ncbi:MAG: hypothetical protein HQL12_08605 [Candidatus Omnitrophica bacterium]|nr:hypothetical protein [Candidatus Omnitrophota bacterium]